MPELSGSASTSRKQIPSVRIGRVAQRQWGVVSRDQVLRCGLSSTGISRWMKAGRLHPVHPGVYAVGHRALCAEAQLAAALLYAGPGAALSHRTAAWWWELVRGEVGRIHVSAPGYRTSIPGVCLHHPRHLAIVRHRRLPVTSVAGTLLDLAAAVSFPVLRRALAEADYRRLVTPSDLERALGRGHSGSAALRRALKSHFPDLALTLSTLEERFIELCERHQVPLPKVNAKVQGLMVDALWLEQRLIVELDGHRAHASVAAIERDRGRELELRATGFLVLRYTWQQINQHPEAVVADLRRALAMI